MLGAVFSRALSLPHLAPTKPCPAEALSYLSYRFDAAGMPTMQPCVRLAYVQILRSRLLHPGLPPEELAKVDPELRAFMECREPDQTEQQGGWR